MIDLYQIYNNKILKAYIEKSDEIKDFFRYSGIEDFLEDLQPQPIDEQVLSAIYKKNKKLGNSDSNIEEIISLLRRENTVVVMSAHQPAMLLGPLYIVYKAINIIKLCRRLKESYPHMNFVPIFWVASEDSDIQEVNFIYLPNTEKILYFDIPKDIIFSYIKKDLNWLSKIETALTAYNTSFKVGVVEFISRAYEASDNLSSFFAALLVQLFKKYGLLVIDPSQDDIKHAVKHIYSTEIEKPTLSTQILLDSFRRLKQAKFLPILHKIPRQCNFFLLSTKGKRYKVFYKDNKYFIGEETYHKAELLKLLEHPSLFATNVVTRPISASTIFKNMIYISGPNELGYLAQLKDIFEFFNVKPPLVLPRISITLFEKHHQNILHKLNLTPEDFILKLPVSKKIVVDKDIISLLKDTKDYVIQKIEELIKLLPQIKDFATKINKKITYNLSLLEERCRKELINKDVETETRIKKINDYFYPEGILQERLFNIFHFILKYGFSIIDKLFDKFPLDYKYHHFITLD